MVELERIAGLARAKFEARFPKRFTAVSSRRADLQMRATQSGLGRSSMVTNGMFEIASSELYELAKLAWADLVHVCHLIGIEGSGDLADELKSTVRRFVEPAFNRIESMYLSTVESMPGTKQDLRTELDAAMGPVEAEIDIFVAALSNAKRSENPVEAAAKIFNFYESVGTLVTGDSAQVNIQYLKDNRQPLMAAIQQVREAVESASGGVPSSTDVLAAEVEQELQKDDPNPGRLMRAMRGLAATIQTVASMRPAYEALKAAAGPLGIPLP